MKTLQRNKDNNIHKTVFSKRLISRRLTVYLKSEASIVPVSEVLFSVFSESEELTPCLFKL